MPARHVHGRYLIAALLLAFQAANRPLGRAHGAHPG
jgi:hypothetical protein